MQAGAGIAMMNVGDRSDQQLYAETAALGELAEALGMDSLWTVEHHFTGHSPVPNPLHLLSYFAGRTRRVQLGTAVLVLPWHDPVRVAEEIAMVDNLSGGRVSVGYGRGTSPIEYAGFRVAMDESRERFAEALSVVTGALTRERFSHQGRFFQIPEISIRPRPVSHPERRFYGAASSPESGAIMGGMGLGLMISPPCDLERMQLVREHRAAAAAAGFHPPPPVAHLYVSVAHSSDQAWERARRHMQPMFEMLDRHHRFSHGPLRGVPGYEHQASVIEPYSVTGDTAARERALEGFIGHHLIGTPHECLERLDQMRAVLGVGHFVGEFSYGGMPFADCEANLRLFASEVAPVMRDAESFSPALA